MREKSFIRRFKKKMNGERKMIARERQKIRHLVEKTDAEGCSMCHYSHDPSDGWIFEEKDFLKLRLWLNSLGLFSLRDEDGIYILWSLDEEMGHLIQQQNETLRRLMRDEEQKNGIKI